MAGLLSSILYSGQGLAAQQAALQATSKNIANVNSAGYARERVNLSATAPGGVQITSIQSLRDKYLDAQVASEGSVTSALQAKYDALSRAQAGLGEAINTSTSAGAVGDTTTGSGVSGALTNFFNSIQALSANPTSATQKQVLLQSANSLSSALNSADANLAAEQQGDTQRVAGDVSDANSMLKSIADLNSQISHAESSSPGSATDLRDQRQAMIEQLSQKMNVTVSTSPDYPNQVVISAAGTNGTSVPLVDRGTVVGNLSFDGSSVSATNNGQASALNITGGSIAGELQARDGTIADLRSSLKTLAGQVTMSINSAYNPAGTGANFFSTNPSSGLLQVDPATTASSIKAGSTDAGSNDLALAMATVGTKTFSPANGDALSGTLSGYYSGTVTNFGAQVAGVNNQITDQSLISAQISNQRDSVSAVSIDEETTNLLQYQKAYEASSKVISVVNTMMDDVLAMVH